MKNIGEAVKAVSVKEAHDTLMRNTRYHLWRKFSEIPWVFTEDFVMNGMRDAVSRNNVAVINCFKYLFPTLYYPGMPSPIVLTNPETEIWPILISMGADPEVGVTRKHADQPQKKPLPPPKHEPLSMIAASVPPTPPPKPRHWDDYNNGYW